MVSNHAEPTFALLRYSLGGDRPSQTAQQTLSPALIQGHWLDTRYIQGGISRLAPRGLAPPLQSLPPILHKTYQMPIPGCSKGARGLSV